MNAELVTELEAPVQRSARTWIVSTIGPATALAGIIWAIAQPERLTLLHPGGETFWWLFVEPPLYVLAVGLVFHFLIVPSLLEDLQENRATSL